MRAIDVNLGSFGWLTNGDLIIAFALRSLRVDDLHVRTASRMPAAQYLCNPLIPRTWRDFVDDDKAWFSFAYP